MRSAWSGGGGAEEQTAAVTVRERKKVALVSFQWSMYLEFAGRLEAEGFDVYWIHSLRSWTERLVASGVPRERILDLSDPADFQERDVEACRAGLAGLELPGHPRIHDLVQMDRLLREMPHDFALRYLAHAKEEVERFLDAHGIVLVASVLDTALQLLTMAICHRQGRLWAHLVALKMPPERWAVFEGHVPDQPLRRRPVTDADREEAARLLESFRKGNARALMRRTATGYVDALRRLRLQVPFFAGLLRARLGHDRINDFASYPLRRIVAMFLRKKVNLVYVRQFLKLGREPRRPYVLFGLNRQPESSIDVIGAFYSDQIAHVRQIARAVPVTHDLLVKLHLSDVDGRRPSGLRELAAIPGVRLIDPAADTRQLILGADLVIAAYGTMVLEAALLGRPAISFTRVYFTGLPAIAHCSSPAALPDLVTAQLAKTAGSDDDRHAVELLAELYASSFPGLPNRGYANEDYRQVDLDSIAEAFNWLHDVASERRSRCSPAQDVASAATAPIRE
ncbi:hypothetical protein [Arenibaculum sp.]|uniref:hypothetical protein n=1 Tax=Arenibaculum sp. TaxID=2865862 RepID=UPI002E0EE79D|nr:hypothetical protein [Arenibaculum sp.]